MPTSKPVGSILRLLSPLLFVTLGSASALGQASDLPPAPVPVDLGPPAPGPALGPPVPYSAAPVPPPPQSPPSPLTYTAPIAPAAPPPGAASDPGADGWGPYGPPATQMPYYFLTEFDLLKPVFHSKLPGGNPLGDGTGPLQVPATSLPWTVSPQFEVGYNLAGNAGFFSLNYRFFNSEGNSGAVIEDTPFGIRTRANLNNVDLDYGRNLPSPYPRYEFQYRLGIRFSDVYLDSQAATDGFSERGSTQFFGVGPHMRFDVRRHVALLPGLDLFGRLDGAAPVGTLRQNFIADVTDDSGNVTESTLSDHRRYQVVPTVNLQVGVGYTPPSFPTLHLTTGYQFENTWYLGQFGLTDSGNLPSPRGELETQGWFLRAQLDF